MSKKAPIKTYNAQVFTARYMPSKELQALLRKEFEKFLIIPVEEMYRHVRGTVPPSRSAAHSCLYLTEGAASMKIGSEHYTIHKGELLFVPAGQVFSFAEGDVNKGYLVHFHNDILVGKFGRSDLHKDFEFLHVWGNPVVKPDKQTNQFVLHLFKRLLVEYREHGISKLDLLQPYFITLLCEVNRAYQPLNPEGQPAAIHLVNQFRQLLFTHLTTHHRVADYAAMLNISPNHLNKTVKAVTHKPPTKWIDEAILQEAKVLLYQSDFPISEIAMAVGMEDQSYFTRLFKKYEGVTPSEFRRMIEKS